MCETMNVYDSNNPKFPDDVISVQSYIIIINKKKLNIFVMLIKYIIIFII